MTGKNRENYNKNYVAYVNSFAPKTDHFRNCLRAFLVGGFICCIGQFFRYVLEIVFHLSGDELAGSVSVLLIFLGTLLTGLGVYDRIGRNAGAGSIVPITGFANSVCSPAIEFKTEGWIYGTAAKMFIVAGPIIVYGVLAGAAEAKRRQKTSEIEKLVAALEAEEATLTEEISTPGIAQNYPELQKRCARLDEVHKALDEAYAEYEKYI